MTTPSMHISLVTIDLTVQGDPDPIIVALREFNCSIWAGEYCNEGFWYGEPPADGFDFFEGRRLQDLPHFDEIFRYVAEQHAANRGNPLGEFLSKSALAMEAEFARRTGSCVYFAEAAGAVKIGWSKRVATRLAQLQTGCPSPIRLLATIAGGKTLEQQLHRRFASARRVGEWFDPTPDLMAYIAEANA